MPRIDQPKPASLTALRKARAILSTRHVPLAETAWQSHELSKVHDTIDREIKWREWVRQCQDGGNWLCLPEKAKGDMA